MSTEAPEILLSHYLKSLKLPTFLREYQKLARLCAIEGVDHVGYLSRLAEQEMIERDRRKVEHEGVRLARCALQALEEPAVEIRCQALYLLALVVERTYSRVREQIGA